MYLSGIGEETGISKGVIGNIYHQELLTWIEIGNGSIQDPFICKETCGKCHKNLVKVVRILCGNVFAPGAENTLHARCYGSEDDTQIILRMIFKRQGRIREETGEGN